MSLVKEDGSVVPKVPGSTVLQPVTETDPWVRVLIPVYDLTPYDNVLYPTQMRQLRFRPGQLIRQSWWDREFAAPAAESVSPATGPAAGGTVVTIKGSGFTLDAKVTVGGNAATAVTVVDQATIKATVPAHAAGAVDVVVTTSGGTSTLTGAFTYA
ncbi:IPT/TIG domain-containing protein [Microtetraspora fusca]|uniref:IPT/TIG domain-containing protein n=1 Tax=Microtetraspora fusca TaxID=1997 RepID=A0ABW6VHF3_MICFU